MMVTNADLAGRFPIWYREADHNAGSGRYFDRPNSGTVDTYGRVISVNARQQVTLNLNNWRPGCPGEERDAINFPGLPNLGGWGASQDTSHAPDYGYIPYTLTGKYYYLEQLQMDAAWSVGAYVGCFNPNPEPESYHRQGHLGVIPNVSRIEAWAIRTMAYAAFISPDGEPEGPYFADKVRNNVAMLEGEHGVALSVKDSPIVRPPITMGKSTCSRKPRIPHLWEPGALTIAQGPHHGTKSVAMLHLPTI